MEAWPLTRNTDYQHRGDDMRYRSRPSEVEAVQWFGDNAAEVLDFVNGDATASADLRAYVRLGGGLRLLAGRDGAQDWVPVPEGHWIVRSPGDRTDHWPVDPDYFAEKYAPA